MGQYDKLKASIKLALTIFPKATKFFKPGKGTFDDPTLWDDDEPMKFRSFHDLDSSSGKVLLDVLRKRLSGIAAIGQQELTRV
jgi:hypothetical protein